MFTPHTQEELQQMNLQNDETYLVEYINKDYFNAQESLEQSSAKVLINDEKILFIIQDPFGMDKFIEQVKVIKKL